MKQCYFSIFFIAISFSLNAQTNMWTWVNGDKAINAANTYGEKGIANAANSPGARQGSVTWKDKDGNLWLFGGQRINTGNYIAYFGPSYFNDLWEYNPGKNNWTWISGDSIVNERAVYGQKGIASAANKPGARSYAVSWTDANGTFWLFGGIGYAATGAAGLLNDLWKYTIQTGWIWVNGDNTVNQFGIYGSENKISVENKPGARQGAVSWADASGNCWLFGGLGYGRDTLTGSLNDVWKYNIAINQWVWVSGSANLNLPGVYGQKGITATTNMPGTRQYASGWIDKNNDLWLFGGQASTQQGSGALNDLWKFDPGKMVWTWVAGDNVLNQLPVPAAIGNISTVVKPGGTIAAISWTDSDDNFWLFGGLGYDVQSETGDLNYLWKYNFLSGYWTWMSTDNLVNINGIYGTEGTAAATNKPGSRFFSAGWIDAQNALWLFGGNGYAEQESGNLNDLWRYSVEKPLTCPSSRILQNDTSCALQVYNIDPVFANANLTSKYILSGVTSASGAGSASGIRFNPGITNVLYLLENDTSQTCSFTIEIDDKTAPVPVLDSLPDITGDCSVTVTDRPKAKDNCAGIITGTTSDSLIYTRQGVYIINWTYNDGHNNSASQQQRIIVKSGTGILAPLTPNLPDIIGACSVTVATIPQASKSCAGIFNATTTNPLSYNKQGVYIINWTYNDNNGTIITQQQKVIVKDSTKPVPAKDTLPDISGNCSITVTNRPTAVDNCAGTIQAITSDPLSYDKQGVYIINWTYDDGNGNSITQQQRVIVMAGTEPLTPLDDSLPRITADCFAAITDKPQASGSCGRIITATTNDPLVYNTQGEHIITWTYSDDNNNSVTQLQTVIIKDNTAPVPDLAFLADIKGECSITVTNRPTATDNCAGKITASTTDPLTYNKQGTHIINWVYDDGNGNTQTQQQKIIIINPVSLEPVSLTQPDITGDCAVVVSTIPTMQDFCLGTISATTADMLSYSKPGTYIIHWSFVTSSDDTVVETQSVIVKNLSLTVNAYPNPANNYFNVLIKTCNHTDKINLRVFDMLGRIIENKTIPANEPVTLGANYAAAAYFIQAMQGKERITEKLIKVK